VANITFCCGMTDSEHIHMLNFDFTGTLIKFSHVINLASIEVHKVITAVLFRNVWS